MCGVLSVLCSWETLCVVEAEDSSPLYPKTRRLSPLCLPNPSLIYRHTHSPLHQSFIRNTFHSSTPSRSHRAYHVHPLPHHHPPTPPRNLTRVPNPDSKFPMGSHCHTRRRNTIPPLLDAVLRRVPNFPPSILPHLPPPNLPSKAFCSS